MRFAISFCFAGVVLLLATAGIMAQSKSDSDVTALREAKSNAVRAERRAEELRQEASNAERAADRVVAQRAALGAEIDAANAQIATARARIAVIAGRQRAQAAQLGAANAPLMRLNALLQKMTAQPTLLMLVRPGSRRDYVHVRATIASIKPVVSARTAGLRRQIAAQRELRAQERIAIQSLADARTALAGRRSSLTKLEHDNRDLAASLTGNAAIEFERAIGQGERARDLVEEIDASRESNQNAAALAELEGPLLGSTKIALPKTVGRAYILPVQGRLLSGFGELSPTGYRERGIRLRVASEAALAAPAAGTVTFAGRYRSFGNIIIIDHGGGWTTLLAYVEALGVEKGARVSQGASIGRAGSNDPQIMVELRRNGRIMDIAALIG
jgi:murein hydrolase activator